MFVHGERIALTLKDSSVLFFDFCPAWGGYYILDASASPDCVVQKGREALASNNYNKVRDKDLKLFCRFIDNNQPLVLYVGAFEPDTETPHYSWSSAITVGVVASVSSA